MLPVCFEEKSLLHLSLKKSICQISVWKKNIVCYLFSQVKMVFHENKRWGHRAISSYWIFFFMLSLETAILFWSAVEVYICTYCFIKQNLRIFEDQDLIIANIFYRFIREFLLFLAWGSLNLGFTHAVHVFSCWTASQPYLSPPFLAGWCTSYAKHVLGGFPARQSHSWGKMTFSKRFKSVPGGKITDAANFTPLNACIQVSGNASTMLEA